MLCNNFEKSEIKDGDENHGKVTTYALEEKIEVGSPIKKMRIWMDISEKVSLMNIYIQSIDMKANEGFATCILIIQVRDTRQLDRLFRKLKQLSNIISISRR